MPLQFADVLIGAIVYPRIVPYIAVRIVGIGIVVGVWQFAGVLVVVIVYPHIVPEIAVILV